MRLSRTTLLWKINAFYFSFEHKGKYSHIITSNCISKQLLTCFKSSIARFLFSLVFTSKRNSWHVVYFFPLFMRSLFFFSTTSRNVFFFFNARKEKISEFNGSISSELLFILPKKFTYQSVHGLCYKLSELNFPLLCLRVTANQPNTKGLTK